MTMFVIDSVAVDEEIGYQSIIIDYDLCSIINIVRVI
jgi:hypothetical protein